VRSMFVLLVVVLLGFGGTTATASAQKGGAVYTLTNSPAGNAVAVFDRAADGSLSAAGSYATGGAGSGGNLGSQGALVLSPQGHRLFAVNAGSNSVSEFRVDGHGLKLVAVAPSGGTTPISATYRHHVLYVLNAGGSGNVAGFALRGNRLEQIASRPLGAGSAGPAQVSFTPDGSQLIVTEKGSRTIDLYPVDQSGVAGTPVVAPSAGATPFGFDFDPSGHLLVSEAGGSASSYAVGLGALGVISGTVTTHQAAPCWLVATRDGRFAYAANGGSGTISGFSVAANGAISLLDASGVNADLGPTSHPLDETISGDGRFLYNLTDGLHRITGFRINPDGSLTQVTIATGLPVGADGIAAS
jgi:6-phosphogluconolactonase